MFLKWQMGIFGKPPTQEASQAGETMSAASTAAAAAPKEVKPGAEQVCVCVCVLSESITGGLVFVHAK